MAFRQRGPFPLLVLLGEQSSAKTSTARLLKQLIDPPELAVRAEPKDVRDLMISARANWVMANDNLTFVPNWSSDAFCRLATGGGFGTRELYSDDEELVFNATRPLVLNGIGDIVTRPDLLERSLLIHDPEIPDDARRPEEELRAELADKLIVIQTEARQSGQAVPSRLPPTAAMRHSKLELTMNGYTDARQLDVASAVEALPALPPVVVTDQPFRQNAPGIAPTPGNARRFRANRGNNQAADGISPAMDAIVATSLPVNGKGSLTITVNEPSEMGATGLEPNLETLHSR